MLINLIKKYLNKIIAFAAVLIGIGLFGEFRRGQGKDQENDRQEKIDHETAKDIRDRVRDHKSDRVRDVELKFRD